MKRLALVLALGMSVTGQAQEFKATPIPPPNFYVDRFTVLPDGSILPTQPLVNTLQPIQQILGNLCDLGSSLCGIAGMEVKPLGLSSVKHGDAGLLERVEVGHRLFGLLNAKKDGS